jgi:hypothetical protein
MVPDTAVGDAAFGLRGRRPSGGAPDGIDSQADSAGKAHDRLRHKAKEYSPKVIGLYDPKR